ncbi:hypothetical protein BDU57DRAFT_171993 [Ampelomyces quisqualis]|uniref:Uncharacterized protein n=1 Tax=Ampelomyces quisqualis TaxID=50730 RepID=A0A6A5QSW9_AMPQU|nr:hypothetical protein BDU57DRAFT_171993 [Ampelomyces quisqualis]
MTRTSNGLYEGAPQQVSSYNLDGENVDYDLSCVFGAPFAGKRLEGTSTTGEAMCGPRVCIRGGGGGSGQERAQGGECLV